jgi:hypothetical protein
VHGFDLELSEGQLLGDRVTALRSALGDGLDEAWAAGADLDLYAAVDLALAALGDLPEITTREILDLPRRAGLLGFRRV